MTAGLTIGSLFAGIGGLELGLEAALGARTVWQVEQDAYCRRVLARHWPDADRSVTDVREAGAATLEPVDVICGGFPCQDISVAGKGAGLAGEKSGLWWEMARVLREMGPRFAVLENVSALAQRGLGAVLGELASQGYDAEWGVLSAESVGAPHLRRRIFVVAWRPDALRARRPKLCSPAGLLGMGRPAGLVDEARAAWISGSRPLGVADGVPSRVDRLRALGNAVVPAVAYEVGLILRELMA